MLRARIPILLLTLTVFSPSISAMPDVDTLVEWMTGSFSSQEQAEADEAYFDIRLEMVEIWKDREDGPWLYIEQAAASNLDRPYRQRIYHLTRTPEGKFSSAVYEFPIPLALAGAWRDPARFDAVTPEDLTLREGCAVILDAEEWRFKGSTNEKECKSSLRGATYATSVVTVTPEGIESWDRGFSAEDEQVWGAEKGAYIFKRVAAVTKPQASYPAPDWFREHLAYLTAGEGRWVADNRAFKSETELFDQYVIEWSYGVGEQSLKGRMFGMVGNEVYPDLWEFRILWHPVRCEVQVHQFGGEGLVGFGTIKKDGKNKTRMEQRFVSPAGAYFHVGHSSDETDPKRHVTQSFEISPDGEWTESRKYTWVPLKN